MNKVYVDAHAALDGLLLNSRQVAKMISFATRAICIICLCYNIAMYLFITKHVVWRF
jgi:hypothetical protein